jgi:hypothetical protein
MNSFIYIYVSIFRLAKDYSSIKAKEQEELVELRVKSIT